MSNALGRLGWLALFLSTTVTAQTAQPEQDIPDLLDRMSRAVHFLDYEGSVVHLQGTDLEAMRISHTEQDGYEREHLIALTGKAHQIVRDEYTTTRFQPERKAVSVEERRHGVIVPALVSFDRERVALSYDFVPAGEARIAGRVTRIILLQPKDGARYGYRLYVDAKYALPLKFDVIDEEKNYISQLMFTDLRIRHETPESIEAASQQGQDLRPVERPAYSGPWRFTKAPPGFELEFVNREETNADVEHFVFSDGIATLSVYIEPDSASGLVGHQKVGAVGVLGAKVEGHQVTVVGEVPGATLRSFVDGMTRG